MNNSMKVYFVLIVDLSQTGHFPFALSSKTKSVTLIYFLFFLLHFGEKWKKNPTVGRFFARASFKRFFFLVKEKEGETTMAATSWSEDNFY